MARKKPQPKGVPEWMVTFGDMMSLLLCFFIMLFAMSIITPKRFQALADTLKQDFTGYSGSSSQKSKGSKTTTTKSESAAKSRRISTLAGGQPVAGPQGESPDVYALLPDGETVRVVCFELGRDELTALAQRDLKAVFSALQGTSQKIMVRGYAAPSEGGGAYGSDTSLAFSRAIYVMDHLVSLGLNRNLFEIEVAPGTVPARNVLPPGTDISLAGASVEIILLKHTSRPQ